MDQSRSESTRTTSSLLSIVIVGVIVVTAFSGSVAGHTGDNGAHHHDGMDGWIGGEFGSLWMIVWTVVLIGVSVALIDLLLSRRRATDGTTDEDALALLRRRYAQGEIDEEEFETRRAKLLAE